MLPLAQLLTRPSSSFKASVNAGVAGHSAVIGLQCTGRELRLHRHDGKLRRQTSSKRIEICTKSGWRLSSRSRLLGCWDCLEQNSWPEDSRRWRAIRNYICRIAQGYDAKLLRIGWFWIQVPPQEVIGLRFQGFSVSRSVPSSEVFGSMMIHVPSGYLT